MLSEMAIRVEASHAVTVVFLAGDLDWEGASSLKTCAATLSDGGRTEHVIIDLSGVVFTDSSGLDAIAECQTQCLASGIAFSVRNPSPLVRRMLVATGDATRLGVVATAPGSGRTEQMDHGWSRHEAGERDFVADLRDRLADERDQVADARDMDLGARALQVEMIMLAGSERDSAAEARDRLAEGRDAAAIHRPGRLDADKRDASLAAIDRWHAGADRDASAEDRHDLARLWRSDSTTEGL